MKATVNTPIADGGKIEMRGATSLSSLMLIGAMVQTAKYDRSGKMPLHRIQTDAKGLEILGNHTEEAINSVIDAVDTLADLLCYADHKELSEHTLTGVGWLLRSLSEIGCQLQDARSMIEYNVQHR